MRTLITNLALFAIIGLMARPAGAANDSCGQYLVAIAADALRLSSKDMPNWYATSKRKRRPAGVLSTRISAH